MSKEEHPYIKIHSDFTKKWKYLIVGTFPPKIGCKARTDLFPFFYGNRGSLWDIVKNTNLYSEFDFTKVSEIKRWQEEYSIGITDVINKCSRKVGKECSPSDANLVVDYKDLNFNLREYILKNFNDIEKIYFTSGSDSSNNNSAFSLFKKLMGNDLK